MEFPGLASIPAEKRHAFEMKILPINGLRNQSSGSKRIKITPSFYFTHLMISTFPAFRMRDFKASLHMASAPTPLFNLTGPSERSWRLLTALNLAKTPWWFSAQTMARLWTMATKTTHLRNLDLTRQQAHTKVENTVFTKAGPALPLLLSGKAKSRLENQTKWYAPLISPVALPRLQAQTSHKTLLRIVLTYPMPSSVSPMRKGGQASSSRIMEAEVSLASVKTIGN